MKIEEIRTSAKDFLTPADVAPALGCDPQTLRVWARKKPEWLGFPVSLIGTRVRIPRAGFLRWYDGER